MFSFISGHSGDGSILSLYFYTLWRYIITDLKRKLLHTLLKDKESFIIISQNLGMLMNS